MPGFRRPGEKEKKHKKSDQIRAKSSTPQPELTEEEKLAEAKAFKNTKETHLKKVRTL